MDNELEGHRLWIAKLITECLPITHSKIQTKHLHLLVRWFPQIDQHGIDGYEKYIKCKNRKATKAARKIFLQCENFTFSKSALQELVSEELPDIFPEHNPPVAAIVEKLLKIKVPSIAKVISSLKRDKYKVIILTTEESSRIPPCYKKKGTSEIRILSIFGKDFKNEIASSIDIKKAINKL